MILLAVEYKCRRISMSWSVAVDGIKCCPPAVCEKDWESSCSITSSLAYLQVIVPLTACFADFGCFR